MRKRYFIIPLTAIIIAGVLVWACKNPYGAGIDFSGLVDYIPKNQRAAGPGYNGEISYNTNGNGVINASNQLPTTDANKRIFYSDNNKNHYRIPAILTLKNGDILAFADYRYNGAGDLPNQIEVYVKKSTNNGTNWGERKIITTKSISQKDGHGDTGVVLDRKTGDVIAVVASGQGFFSSKAEDPIRIKVIRSKDNGENWSTPVDITSQIYGPGCKDSTRRNWQAAFATSGNGLQLRNGRIMFVLAVRETTQTDVTAIKNYVMYSDDGGYKWKVSSGAPKNTRGGNEAKVVELNQDGHILMNIRPNSPGPWKRLFAHSYDYGETWTEAKIQNDLPSSGSNGDMIYYTSTKNGYDRDRLITLVDSRPYSGGPNGGPGVPVFYVSYDEGQSWTKSKMLWNGNAGYSSLTILKDGSIGILAELTQSWNGPIWFLRASVEWCDPDCPPSRTQSKK